MVGANAKITARTVKNCYSSIFFFYNYLLFLCDVGDDKREHYKPLSSILTTQIRTLRMYLLNRAKLMSN